MQRAALFSGGDAQMAAGDLGELLVPYMPTIRVPKSGDRVYKTECAFSYDSPVSAAKPSLAAPPPTEGCRPALSRRPAPHPPLFSPFPALCCTPSSMGCTSTPLRAAYTTSGFTVSSIPPFACLHLPRIPRSQVSPRLLPYGSQRPPPPRLSPALPRSPHCAAGPLRSRLSVRGSGAGSLRLFLCLRRSGVVA